MIEVSMFKDGKSDYNFIKTDLSTSTIYFYMKDIDKGVYKIAKSNAIFNNENNSIYFQFSKKNTDSVGRYEGEFKIQTEQGIIDLPLKEKLYINVLDSLSNPDFCCGPNKFINPEPVPVPAPAGIYYGKLNSETINSSQVSNLTFLTTSLGAGYSVVQPSGLGYGYILTPIGFDQPSGLRESNSGCNGAIIPYNNIGTINLIDENSFVITYNIYRTYYPFNGEVIFWLCN